MSRIGKRGLYQSDVINLAFVAVRGQVAITYIVRRCSLIAACSPFSDFRLRDASEELGSFLRRENHRHIETNRNTRPSWSPCARGGAGLSVIHREVSFVFEDDGRENVRGPKTSNESTIAWEYITAFERIGSQRPPFSSIAALWMVFGRRRGPRRG